MHKNQEGYLSQGQADCLKGYRKLFPKFGERK